MIGNYSLKFMNKLKIIITTLLFFIISAEFNSVEAYVVGASAQLKSNHVEEVEDYRVTKLEAFFEKYDSPLASHAGSFVFYADIYGLDWRLVPAISGVESTFGKRIPYNSYNAYGWANGAYKFSSWDESIEIVSKTLREKYYDKGATTIYQIARRYAPPSNTWAGKVKYFMNKIDPLPVIFTI